MRTINKVSKIFSDYFSFLRHWNRGEGNSCARTDLTFKAVPQSKLARKREERMRREAEKNREDQKASSSSSSSAAMAAASRATTGLAGQPSKNSGPIETISAGIPGSSPYDRFRYGGPSAPLVSPTGHGDHTPALRQLK